MNRKDVREVDFGGPKERQRYIQEIWERVDQTRYDSHNLSMMTLDRRI